MFCIFIDNAESGDAQGIIFIEFDKSIKNWDVAGYVTAILGDNPLFYKVSKSIGRKIDAYTY